ncbi:MAG: acyl-CoA dehydrogenase [Gammaproteobacteria bacterium]|jgi:alkylation response protein AidB-like acyl-CoA dehydrogenase|nr:acyl-CoA dehydrogenase [Gammaproteobacteria bacterium]
MNLHLTVEQQMLRSSVARLLQTESSPARVRRAEAGGFDSRLWAQLNALGIAAMRVPEHAGGGGMSLFDAALVAEEMGRCLASVPFAESLPATRLLAALDGEPAKELLEAALDGGIVVMLPQELRPDETRVATVVEGGVVLALDGGEVVAIRGLDGRPVPNLGSGPFASVVLSGANAEGERRVLASGRAARAAFLAAIEEWKLLKAAMLVGVAHQALQMSAAYAVERHQFGKPIGSFQGVAHPLADALAEVDGARLLVWHAISAIAHDEHDAAALVSMAWWWAAQTSARVVAQALRTFGGYGVSLEYDIQLYYRRAKAWSLLAGDPQLELHAVADRLWGGGPAVPLPDAGEVSVTFGLGKAADAFADEVRRFFAANLTDELKAHAHHSVAGYHQGFHKQLAQAGLLFPHWPTAYGGREKSVFDVAALEEVFEEVGWQRITGPVTNQVAQTVMMFGSETLKREVLPRFASGDAVACLGFTEPSSGSDVFAARTRAERSGDEWLVNGQKIFTTAADVAGYIFLLVRTAPELPKHAGLTLFLVPMDLPGIEIQAIHTMQDERSNLTYLSEVRVPDRYRIGEVNGGTAVMSASLEIEHGGNQYRLSFSNMYRHAVAWAKTAVRDGRALITQPDARRRLARVAVHQVVATDLCYRALWAAADGVPGRVAFGPMSKLFSTEHYRADAADLMDLAAPESLFPGRDGLGHVEIGYRQSIGMTLYGGTSEVHRSLVAEQGLGMPRSRT